MVDVRKAKDGIVFRVRLVPRARRDELAGVLNGALKIRLTAPPVEGRANEACVRFLARFLGVPRASVFIVTGHTAREKLIRVEGMDEGSFRERVRGNVR